MDNNGYLKIEEETQTNHWVIETKIIPPARQTRNLQRDDLLAALHQSSISVPVTLISAPAGYGKTTLASALYHAYDETAFAWISLDKDDNDPTRFLVNLIAALHRADQKLVRNASNLIKSMPNPAADMKRLIGVLINDLTASKISPIILVLDDLHVITEEYVIQTLDYLIEYIPEALHLVICSRHNPPLALPRLRARGQLVEYRIEDLKFSLDDIQDLYNQKNDIPLSAESFSLLKTHSEGWAAGLNILLSSIERIPTSEERDSFISQLPASNRSIFEYLTDEVLSQQEPHIRKFLLETSILQELNPKVCQAVTGQKNSAEILEDLYQRNLFLIPVSEFESTYRYHDLFANFLQKRLEQEAGQEQVRELHRLAGMAQENTSRAITHYLSAEFWEEAAQTIVQVGRQMMYRGLLETIKRWGECLPSDVINNNPHITFLLGFCAFHQGEFGKAQQFVDQSLAGFKNANDEFFIGETILLAGNIASGLHDIPRSKTLLDEALGHPLSPHLKINGHINRAWVGVYSNNWKMAEEDVNTAIQLALQMEDADAFNMLAPHLTAVLLFIPNGIKRLKEYCTQVLTWFEGNSSPAVVSALSLLGNIHLFQGNQIKSYKMLERAKTMSQELGGFVWLDMNIDLMFLGHFQITSDFVAFESYWEEQLSKYETISGLREYLCVFLFIKGKALLLQGRLEEAKKIYERMTGLEKPNDLPENMLSRALMSAKIAIYEDQFLMAEGILRQVANIQQQAPYSILFGDARVLLCILYYRWEKIDEAVSELKPTLADYQRLGLPGLLALEAKHLVPLLRMAEERKVDFSVSDFLQILDIQYSDRSVVVSSTGEVLTSREMEVLRLIATGASNHDIASQLVISMPTVKSHVTNILRKLDVKSRTQAVAQARELLIL